MLNTGFSIYFTGYLSTVWFSEIRWRAELEKHVYLLLIERISFQSCPKLVAFCLCIFVFLFACHFRKMIELQEGKSGKKGHHSTRSRLVCLQALQAQNTWCMRQLVYIENCMGKSPIVKKNV